MTPPDLRPIETSVQDARMVIGHTLDELAVALDNLDVSLGELREQQARSLRDSLALHLADLSDLPENVRPIRARAV